MARGRRPVQRIQRGSAVTERSGAMPGSRRAKKGQTQVGKNSRAPLGDVWDEPSLQEFDGRKNTNAGDAGHEPGGRWSAAYYETPPKIVGKVTVRTPGA